MKIRMRRTAPTGSVPARTVTLTGLLQLPVLDADRHPVGRVTDTVTKETPDGGLVVTGLLVALDGRHGFVPMTHIRLSHDAVLIDAVAGFVTPYESAPDDLLLVAGVLGGRLIDLRLARLVRARDITMTRQDGRWMVAGVTVEWGGWWHHLPGPLGPRRPHRAWTALERLTRTEDGEPMAGRAGPGLARLKPAQIADLIERASAAARSELLADLRTDPDLEAAVVEELDLHHAARLWAERPDPEIAVVLSRMGADRAADVIATLPSDRLRTVLDLMPAHQRVKLSTLLGYNPTTAGGLMGVDFLAVDHDTDARDALALVTDAVGIEAPALTSVYLLDHARLTGAVTLAELVQAAPGTPLDDLADHNPVRVGPNADAIDVALLMCDHNLLSLPVTDPQNHMIGVITVDDVLETTIPVSWRRRIRPGAPPFANSPRRALT